MEYKLTTRDKNYLKYIGYDEKDVEAIDYCSRHCTYMVVENSHPQIKTPIDREKCIKIIGKMQWLNGIARATFHRDACRYNDKGTKYVYITNTYYANHFK